MKNQVFSCFVFYGVLLVMKMYIIAIITGQMRLRKKVSDYDLERRTIAEKAAWVQHRETFTDNLFSFLFPSTLKGFCQPRGHAETRRVTVSQRGSICGKMPESSYQRHREHPPLPLPGCYLLHDWTWPGCGPPSLPGLLLSSCAAQRCLPVCPASANPLSGLHRCTDTLPLYGSADPNGSLAVCLNTQKRGTELEVLF